MALCLTGSSSAIGPSSGVYICTSLSSNVRKYNIKNRAINLLALISLRKLYKQYACETSCSDWFVEKHKSVFSTAYRASCKLSKTFFFTNRCTIEWSQKQFLIFNKLQPFNVSFNVNLKLFLRPSNFVSVDDKR